MVRDFMGLSGSHAALNQLQGDDIYSNSQTLSTPAVEVLSLNATSIAEAPEAAFEEDEKRQQLEHLVGYRAGILSASFSFSQVLTALLWGSLVNKGGTKPLIQISQLSAVATNLVLGFAPTYTFALIARFLSGLLNSITGAVKTNVARSFDVTRQPKVFGYTMSCWAMGSILGPCFGGLVAEPCATWSFLKTYPICDSSTGLLMQFPFLIPFAGSALISALSCIVAVYWLQPEESVRAAWPVEDEEQTVASSDMREEQEAAAASDEDDNLDTTALLKIHSGDNSKGEHGPLLGKPSRSTRSSLTGGEPSTNLQISKSMRSERSLSMQSVELSARPLSSDVPLLEVEGKLCTVTGSEANAQEKRASVASSKDILEEVQNDAEEPALEQSVWWKDRDVKMRICGYGALAVLFSFIGESMPIFSAMSLHNRGLGYSSTEFAIPAGVGGVWLMISSTLIYPRVNKSLGNQRTVTAGLSIMILVTAAYPWLSLIAGNKALCIVTFCTLYSMQSLAVNFTFASGNVMVNEAGLRPHLKDQIGSINGAGHMIASSVRAVGPAFAGVLWSLVTASHLKLGVFVPFLLCTVCAFLEIKFYQLM